jgi:hypothetical protein
MSSIDKEEEDEARFNFNKPFAFIDFKISDSSTFLSSEIDWNEKLFIWLDYDNPLSLDMIDDIKLIGAKAKPLDIFIVTIEAEPLNVEQAGDFSETFHLYLKGENIKKRAIESLPETLNEIVHSSIQEGLITQVSPMNYLQIFNIVYNDTKKMFTFGGIFFRDKEDAEIKTRLSGLDYLSYDKTIVNIDCPLLTPKEKLYLDSLIKAGSVCKDAEGRTGLDEEEINRYAKFYKHYPQFFESIY